MCARWLRVRLELLWGFLVHVNLQVTCDRYSHKIQLQFSAIKCLTDSLDTMCSEIDWLELLSLFVHVTGSIMWGSCTKAQRGNQATLASIIADNFCSELSPETCYGNLGYIFHGDSEENTQMLSMWGRAIAVDLASENQCNYIHTMHVTNILELISSHHSRITFRVKLHQKCSKNNTG